MSNEMNRTTHHSKLSDVDWTAFQYLAGELNDEAAHGFEACLESDQGAREALARAVQLSQAVAVVEATRQPSIHAVVPASDQTNPIWMAPTAWLAIAALACVAVLAFVSIPKHVPRGRSIDLAANANTAVLDSGELASRWASTAEILVATEFVGADELDEFEDDLPQSLDGAARETESDVSRLQAPSWMMAAFAAATATELRE